jgi:transcriptional regulator with XRE-family HTH domain
MKDKGSIQLNNGLGPMDAWVGHRISTRIANLGVSKRYVAEKMGIGQLQLRRYILGLNRMSLQRLYDVSIALRIAPSWFFEGSPDLPMYGEVGVADAVSEHLSPENVGMLQRFGGLSREHKALVNQIIAALPQEPKR